MTTPAENVTDVVSETLHERTVHDLSSASIIHRLTAEFAKHGATLVERRPSALTDVHTRLHGRLSTAVRQLNHAFFLTRWPGPALSNVFVFRTT